MLAYTTCIYFPRFEVLGFRPSPLYLLYVTDLYNDLGALLFLATRLFRATGTENVTVP